MANAAAVKINLTSYYNSISIGFVTFTSMTSGDDIVDLSQYLNINTVETVTFAPPTNLINLKQSFSNRPREGQLFPRNTN